MRTRPPVALVLAALLACKGDDSIDSDTDVDSDTLPPTVCETLGLSELPFDTSGPFGWHRRELAGDFEVPLLDGDPWRLSENWTGCDGLVVIPHYLTISQNNASSVWTTGVAELVERSPRNARYLFLPIGAFDGNAETYGRPLLEDIDQYLAGLSEDDAAWWRDRLMVAGVASDHVDGWLADVFDADVGAYGIGVDRFQRVRPLGSLASIEAYNPDAGDWPFESRLFPAAYEVEYWNFEADRQAALDAVDATVVDLFVNEVHEQYEDITVTLPDAATLATFDTLEIDVLMECPDREDYEAGNCGPWDYLAHLWLDEDGTWLEAARFITSYHRESRWVVDASQALPWLAAGGTRTFRYEWAPSWNVQPAALTVRLRFSNQAKGVRPVATVPLFTGGAFNSAYNTGRAPIDVAIPAGTKKVELIAITTGHGADTQSCAEFCKHQHEYTVGSSVYLQEFPEASTETGCQETVGTGTVPNQLGTWWFGRGGWCPGREVNPFVVDVTGDAPAGSAVTTSYRGMLNNREPPDNAGNIVLQSWLVLYE